MSTRICVVLLWSHQKIKRIYHHNTICPSAMEFNREIIVNTETNKPASRG